MRGVFVGVLALAAIEAAVSSQRSAQRVGGLLSFVGSLVDRLLDPTVPAIPDLSGVLGKSGNDQSAADTAGGTVQQVATTTNTAPRHAPAAVIVNV